MAATKTDYYEVLGVARDADEETIRRAFHTAARQFHPDVSTSPDADRRFRELAEAYAVLSKPGSRLLYDRYGYRGRGHGGFDEALWEGRSAAARGESIRLELELELYEAQEGARKLVHFQGTAVCSACNGVGTIRPPDPNCAGCDGTGWRRRVSRRDIGRILQIEPCPECAGDICPQCGGSGRVPDERRLWVRIPPGIEDGAQLRVGGEGEPPKDEGIPGDLFVDVRVTPPPRDLRSVRYVAAGLFLVAVVALIAYLLG